MSIMTLQVVSIYQDGSPHGAALEEVAEALHEGLVAIGLEAHRSRNHFAPDAINLVVGWHLLSQAQVESLPDSVILYNLEQLDGLNQPLCSRLVEFGQRFELWDFSRRNIRILHQAGLSKPIQHVPIGTVPSLTRIPQAPVQDIDVLFYGSINERRAAVLDALRQKGLHVHAAFGVYGEARDQLIARSKVVLNVHFYDASIFEIVRASYLWANHKAVVAERHAGTELEAGLESAACFVPYEQLVQACCDLVADTAARKRLEEAGFHAISLRQEADYLKRVLAGESEVPPPATPDTAPTGPDASIIIPVFNKVAYTRACLERLISTPTRCRVEILVVDNASTDETPEYLSNLGSQVRVLRQNTNLGFVDGCNAGAAAATGRHLAFLNNDTTPEPGWLDALVDMVDQIPGVGAAGAKLVYPDGRLQEAGGLIFKDASGWNFGRFEDPSAPAYNLPCEVDYCSGAALLVRRDLFERLGGFDRRYAPAYYEDTDLCFGIRQLGHKVMYCPASVVVHHEGITAGTDLNTGFKRYQAINRKKFAEKWGEELARQDPPPQSATEAPKTASRQRLLREGVAPASSVLPAPAEDAFHVLVVDPYLPLHDMASGSLRLLRIVQLFRVLGCRVTYIALRDLHEDRYRPDLERLGVRVFAGDPEKLARQGVAIERPHPAIDLPSLFAEHPCDLAWLSFFDIAELYLPDIRRISPETRLVIDTVDVHFLRETRTAELHQDPAGLARAALTQARELAIYAQADCVVTVTEDDAKVLQQHGLQVPIEVIPNIHTKVPQTPGWGSRDGFIFVGNFFHPPNVDAALWLGREVFPRILKLLPEAKLQIVGPNPPAELLALAGPQITVTGWVPETAPYLDSARVSLAPLRVGAGMKGKVGEALSRGLPVVTTPIGAEGMHLEPGRHLLVEASAETLAEAAVRLHQDPVRWSLLAQEGRDVIEVRYGMKAVMHRLFHAFMNATPDGEERSGTIPPAEVSPSPGAAPKATLPFASFVPYDYPPAPIRLFTSDRTRSFQYSDGDESENFLFEVLSKAQDLSETSTLLAAAAEKDWPSRYHLSAERGNLLRWMDLDASHSVLEIGSGCGAMSRHLGEKGVQLCAVEGSKNRAFLAALRCRDLPNVQVYNANIQEIEPTPTFDVVTLIGVLEYAGKYISSPSPWTDLLRIARSFLKPDGLLIIAIENKVGMKYWTGCTEDHGAGLFASIEGYPDQNPVQTFSLPELKSLCNEAGFGPSHPLFPWPDYKIPNCVMNQPTPEDHLHNWVGSQFEDYADSNNWLIHERLATRTISRAGLLGELANSFLLLVSASQDYPTARHANPAWKAISYTVRRASPYWTQTTFIERNLPIEKTRLHATPLPTCPPLAFYPEGSAWIKGDLLEFQWTEALRSQNVQNLVSRISEYRAFLVHTFGTGGMEGSYHLLQPEALDCLPRNIICTPSGLQPFDLEWRWTMDLPEDLVVTRAIFQFTKFNRNWVQKWFPHYAIDRVCFDLLRMVYPGLHAQRFEIFMKFDHYLWQAVAFQIYDSAYLDRFNQRPI